MASRPGDPLNTVEQEVVLGLDPAYLPLVLRHRERTLQRGVPYVVRVGRRDREQQAEEFAEGKGKGVAPGTSKHEIGWAHDAYGPRNEREWAVFGEEAEALGLEWGGRYSKPERWHIEAPADRRLLVAHQTVRLLALGTALGITGLVVFHAIKQRSR